MTAESSSSVITWRKAHIQPLIRHGDNAGTGLMVQNDNLPLPRPPW